MDRLSEVAEVQMGSPNDEVNDVGARSIEAALQERLGKRKTATRFGSNQMIVEHPAQRSNRLQRMIFLIEKLARSRQGGHHVRGCEALCHDQRVGARYLQAPFERSEEHTSE